MVKRKKAAEESPVGMDNTGVAQSLAPPLDITSRRKKSATSRIGRACDRCQHRKLACDPAPEGCPPCQRVNAWCTVTDPLTGTPTYRGEFEYLERQVTKQHDDIKELVAKLKALGEDVSAYEEETPDDKRYLAWRQVKASGDTRPWDRDERQQNVSRHLGSQPLPNGGMPPSTMMGQSSMDLPLPLDASSKADALKLPDLRTGLAHADPRRYVGVALQDTRSDGPKLNLLGWQINLAQFTSGDVDESTELPTKNQAPVYDRSHRSFVATAFGINPKIRKVEIPARDEALRWGAMYVSVLEPFAPIFHGPSFTQMILNFYDDPKFWPSPAEEVCFHIMIAVMLFQDATRNFEETKAHIHNRSDQHYHYALGFFPQILMGNTIRDAQALCFVSMHVRNFPKPEIGWIVATMAFNKLIAMGYHRSSKLANGANRADRSFRDLELQKRVFHTTLMILITAGGKIGRPMPIRLEDFDIESPLPVPDEQLLETHIDSTNKGHCTFLVGLEAQKVSKIYLELYNVMYATKRSSKEYMQFVGIAERRIKSWEDQWPQQFKGSPEKAEPLTRVFISYLHFWAAEFRLLLHHPSLSLTKSFQFNNENLRSCLAAARGMLKVVRTVQDLKSLDTTWYNCAVYMLAIQTTFYGYDQLKDELTDAKLKELRSDMDAWLSIMGDIGGLLGSGRRLKNAIGEQIKIGLAQLEKHLRTKKQLEQQKAQAAIKAETKMEPGTRVIDTSAVPTHRNSIGSYQDPHSATGFQTHNGFPPNSNPQGMSINTFPNQVTYGYTNNTYNTSPTAYGQPFTMNMATQALSSPYGQHTNAAAQGHMDTIYDTTNNNYTTAPGYSADSDSWYNYAQNLPGGVIPQDYQPASALMQLGGRADHNMGGNLQGMADGYDTSSMSGGAGVVWPLGALGTLEDNHGQS